jgi:hypothetical protein
LCYVLSGEEEANTGFIDFGLTPTCICRLDNGIYWSTCICRPDNGIYWSTCICRLDNGIYWSTCICNDTGPHWIHVDQYIPLSSLQIHVD